MIGSIPTWFLSLSAIAMLGGCCLTSALEVGETTTGTGGTTSGAGTGSSSGNVTDAGCGGSATLTGETAFPVQQIVFCAARNEVDGGPDLGQFSVEFLADGQGLTIGRPFGGTCPTPSSGTAIDVWYGSGRSALPPLDAGTYPLDGGTIGFDVFNASTDATIAQVQGGTVTFSTLTVNAVAGGFDIMLSQAGAVTELKGSFESTLCGFLGPPGP